MIRNDISLRWAEFLNAIELLSRLPVPGRSGPPSPGFVWAFPIVGAALGGIAALAGLLMGAHAEIGAGVALAVMTMLSGGLHEDGLADTADGLWGGQTSARRLEIMKDSRIGSYGVLAMIIVFGLRWMALAAAGLPALIVSAALSRAVMPGVMAWLPFARPDGLSQSVGRVPKSVALIACALGVLIAVLIIGVPGLWVALVAGGVAAGLARIALSKIGGQTGDILGAVQQLSEMAILIFLATVVA